ncbi:MAG: SufE family protein [Gemmatimonadetes bacterium]|jgi:cysteine desulfuration protein SufE|nr:SufE family protein [Gemmatimonadota bacterium]
MTPDEFAERFNRLRSSEDRYRYLIQLGRKLEPYPEEFRDEEHLVPGCMSQVWLVTVGGSEPSEVVFRADSDAHIVKGLIAVLLMLYSGKTAEEILTTNVQGLFERLDLGQHISVNRRNGFYSMTLKMREHAAQKVAVMEEGE